MLAAVAMAVDVPAIVMASVASIDIAVLMVSAAAIVIAELMASMVDLQMATGLVKLEQ